MTSTPLGLTPISAQPPKQKNLTRWLFALGMALNILVCIPFLIDPFNMLGATEGKEGVNYVVFLADGHSENLRKNFFRAHPQTKVLHQGDLLGTVQVQIPSSDATTLQALKDQPFTTYVMKGGGLICQ